jgi:GNAT superfamily N-acetyltransferase
MPRSLSSRGIARGSSSPWSVIESALKQQLSSNPGVESIEVGNEPHHRYRHMIRSATSDDLPTICHLIRRLAEFEQLADEAVFDEARLREHLFGARPFAEVLLAEEDAQVVGFALFFHNYSTFVGKPGIYLEDLFVEPEYRGRGHGKALLKAVASLAVERDCGRMEWSVLNWNEAAIRFYQSLGAQPMDGWTLFRLTGEALRIPAK